jgi:hypothetical protein
MWRWSMLSNECGGNGGGDSDGCGSGDGHGDGDVGVGVGVGDASVFGWSDLALRRLRDASSAVHCTLPLLPADRQDSYTLHQSVRKAH